MQLREQVRGERAELADLLADLSLAEWNTASLCEGWRVRDVVGHLFCGEELNPPQIAGLWLLAAFDRDRVNELALAPIRDMPPALLVATARTHITPRRFAPGFRLATRLTETVVHQQDIRRPLRRPRTIPEDRLRAALAALTRSPGPRVRRLRHRLRLVADDVDWSCGAGPAVHGPAEALLMCLAGRPSALADCAGPGLDQLRARLSAA